MRGIFASCALSVLLLAAAWADHNPNHHPNHHHHHHPNHPHHGSDHSHNDKLSSANADFGFALYKSLNTNAAAGKNIFFSPLGISSTLSMLSTGAKGETHRQLFFSLGYSTFNQTQVNKAYKHLFNIHGHSQENQHLDVGNAVALHSGFSPLKTFLKDVKHYYFGHVFNVNLTKPAKAAAEINTFIANKTQDKIKDMVKDLDPAMVMVLINYVYFKGQWKTPFNLDMTRKMNFHVANTKKVQVDMMMRSGYYDTYWDVDNHTTVILLPYHGNTSMMIVLPDEGKMKEVEGYINKDYIRHWHDSVSMEYVVDLFLPKFTISADAPLENTLKEMGITDAFEGKADFSGMSDKVKLKVSKASHKAVLSVTEMGTEAAATSITELVYISLPRSVRIDRPFLVFILENLTKSILFMGKINNPTAM
ncbi:alpha-1-antitrypsin homolog [Anoplopoma fimbria]|uniref:alpha-1-antitrypsin homolog n=1 Tax=Anoplopoma fimbria TaxID=229290 RepID=UPI0023EBCF1D|nr:alpha-1-antitrypsin homolog [Anoplopoma fimbria]